MLEKKVWYAECMKIHHHLGASVDGCQEFYAATGHTAVTNCLVCGCARNFHRKLIEYLCQREVVVYTETECNKNHNLQGSYSRDGCGEFKWISADEPSENCAACGCHRNFHQRKVTPFIK